MRSEKHSHSDIKYQSAGDDKRPVPSGLGGWTWGSPVLLAEYLGAVDTVARY